MSGSQTGQASSEGPFSLSLRFSSKKRLVPGRLDAIRIELQNSLALRARVPLVPNGQGVSPILWTVYEEFSVVLSGRSLVPRLVGPLKNDLAGSTDYGQGLANHSGLVATSSLHGITALASVLVSVAHSSDLFLLADEGFGLAHCGKGFA